MKNILILLILLVSGTVGANTTEVLVEKDVEMTFLLHEANPFRIFSDHGGDCGIAADFSEAVEAGSAYPDIFPVLNEGNLARRELKVDCGTGVFEYFVTEEEINAHVQPNPAGGFQLAAKVHYRLVQETTAENIWLHEYMEVHISGLSELFYYSGSQSIKL